MSVQSTLPDASCDTVIAPVASSLTRRHQRAQASLERAFKREQRVAVLVGVDSLELGQVVSAFVEGLDQRTTSVRLRNPQANALAAFGEINRAIGFDPKDLTLSDLQNVLTLFLEYQCNHHHRTVLCVEKADEQSMWLLDCFARLVSSCQSTPVGRSLMVVLTGSPRLIDILQSDDLDVIRTVAGTPTRIGPLSIFETREFLRSMSANAGHGDIQSLFEFDAVERLHNLSGGVPNVVAKLFRECMALTRESGHRPATSKVVAAAARNLRAEASIDARISPPRPALVAADTADSGQRRLRIQIPELEPLEVELQPGRYMIGRGATADIKLSSPAVSRRHALLIDTGESVQFLDLGSVNGVYIDGERVAEGTLEPGSVLSLADCRVEYHAGD
ncbi:MAG: FHA domain-containing protein [Woeseiaceae bacterium]|nr:FHA domain-containing protein [Woeseiaceae bacterium]